MEEKLELILGEIKELREHIDKKFAQVDKRFEQVDKRFEQVEQRIEKVEQKIENVEQRFDQRFENIVKKLDNISTQVAKNAEQEFNVHKLAAKVEEHDADIKLLKKAIANQ